ncbi:MAG: DUF3417 domain-containing protein, partial [Candidatus Hydrogenedentes bacterium]|nr:DUF3417 domain-containing protein [Candidatus Hydrogenedentota bacterium]
MVNIAEVPHFKSKSDTNIYKGAPVMARIIKYTVIPRIPESLTRLNYIANNLWWCWNPDAIELFFRMDRDLWI